MLSVTLQHREKKDKEVGKYHGHSFLRKQRGKGRLETNKMTATIFAIGIFALPVRFVSKF
jgi:hypothetical protein